MSLTRKRKKELGKLRSSAEELWSQQQEILDRANAVAREASRQAGYLTKEELAPRVRDGYYTHVHPRIEASGRLASSAAYNARDRLVGDVIPAVGSVIGTAMSVVDHARDARERALSGVRPARKVVEQKSGPGAGTVIAVGIGVIAAVGLLYAVWQTFRADDELWVADEEPPATPAE